MLVTWDGAEQFVRLEAERDHSRGRLPRPIMIAFQAEEARVLGFCRQPRPDEPGLGMALFELAQFVQLIGPDRLLCAVAVTLRPLTVEPLVGRASGGRALVVETATGSGRRVRVAARLLPYGIDDDGALRWEEPVSLPENTPTPMKWTLRAALLPGPARTDRDLGEVAAVLSYRGHLIAAAPGVIDDPASQSRPSHDGRGWDESR